MNIAELLLDGLQRYGERVTVHFEDSSLTNVEMLRSAEQLATVLTEAGVQRGDRVLLMMYNCPEVIQAFHSIWRIGAVAVPVTPQWLAREVRYVIEHSGAQVVLTSPALAAKLGEATADLAAPCQLFVFGNTDVPSARNIEPLIAHAAPWAKTFPAEPSDSALFIYTSGTTGQPKGVVLTHGSIQANVDSVMQTFEPNPEVVTLYVLPLSHVFGVLCMNMGAVTGGPGVILPSFDAKRVLESIERYRVERFAAVPTMLTSLLNHPERANFDCSSLRGVDSGGAPLPEELRLEFQRVFNCRVKEGYGCSEASCALTFFHDDDVYRPGSVGKALPGVIISIQDDSDQPLMPEQEGEICAKGENIMQGYWQDHHATLSTIRNGWLHTGDVGRMDADGFIYITGRKKDLIIKGGENIAPRALEEALYEHPAVAEAAVIGVPHPLYGEDICAVVVLRAGKTASAEELQEHVAKYVSKFKVPATVVFRDELPKSPVGKILKRELRRLLH
ncbi:MAG: AMP-binding protein [Pirellulaceae bacterium]|nr:AMP-binding protein [Pirellulaceae bacterium]